MSASVDMSEYSTEVIRFEMLPNDILRSVWVGEAQAADIVQMRKVGAEQRARLPDGPSLSLVDGREAAGFGPDTRAEMNLLGEEKPWDYVALVGVPFGARIAINLITRALTLLKVDIADVRFFDTEEEGMAWLESKRSAG